MDGNTLQKIRDVLLVRRRELGTLGSEMEREVGDVLENGAQQAEMVDIAQAVEHLDRNASLVEQERRELVAIERALAKMASGTYGVCEDCDEEIPSKRLFVLPHARLCAKCQEYEERQQGRIRGGMTGAMAR